MVLGELDWCMQKMKLDHQLTPYTRISSKWIKDITISYDTIKVLVANIGSKISDIPHRSICADISPTAGEIKKIINIGEYTKLKSFCTAEETIMKMKRELLYGRTYLPMIHQTRV